MDRDGKSDQRHCLYHMVRRIAQRAAFMVYLSGRMRVRDLDKSSQQH
jgi:hypothetical protein